MGNITRRKQTAGKGATRVFSGAIGGKRLTSKWLFVTEAWSGVRALLSLAEGEALSSRSSLVIPRSPLPAATCSAVRLNHGHVQAGESSFSVEGAQLHWRYGLRTLRSLRR